MTESFRLNVLDALTHGSVAVPVWHLAPRDRWRLFRDTLLGHVPIRGGMRTRDLPLDPVARTLVATSTAIQASEYEVGSEVKCRFGDWLCLYSILVEPLLARSGDADEGAAHAALRQAIRELRQALGLGELGVYAMNCPFHHRLLGVLGLSRQEWTRDPPPGADFKRERGAARLGARVCAAWRTSARDSFESPNGDLLAWAVSVTGANAGQRPLFDLLASEKRVLATLKPIDVQSYIHRARTHWMMRGASTWCAQSLAFARDRIVASHDALLLSDSDALVSFILPAGTPDVVTVLDEIKTAWADHAAFAARFPRLGADHPGSFPAGSDGRGAVDPSLSLPCLSLRFSPATSLLDLCVGRVDGDKAKEASIGWSRVPPALQSPGGSPCKFVTGETAIREGAPVWLKHRRPRQPEAYGWTALCWSLSGTTLRTHWHHGVCTELERNDYTMMHESHGGWLEQLQMKEDSLTFVKLDGDGVGDGFLRTPIPGRPHLGLALGRHVLARVIEGTRRVIEAHDASGRPKFLPVDLVYVGGDDIFFCLPGSYLGPFLQGFDAPQAADSDPWDSLAFSFISVALPPAAEFQADGQQALSAEFGRANLAAALTLSPGLRTLVKDSPRGATVGMPELSELNAAIRERGYRCEPAETPGRWERLHGVSLALVRTTPNPPEKV